LPSGFLLDRRYRIAKALGSGGMGTVYRATDEETEKEYAIKTLRPELTASAMAIADLKKEVATAQDLTHPNILRINYLGVAGGTVYLVMEYIDGENLEAFRLGKGGRITADEFRRLIPQLLAGLNYLHDKGKVHLDIKPQNVMVTRAAEVKLTDFGIAKSIRQQLDQREEGQVPVGSLCYMSPEQLRGEVCDRRSDIYSLGVMFYLLLLGEFPFSTKSRKDVASWHLGPEFDTSGLSGEWQDLFSKCLARDKAQRFKNCEEIIRAIGPESAGVPARPPLPDIAEDAAYYQYINRKRTGVLGILDYLDPQNRKAPLPVHPDSLIADCQRLLSSEVFGNANPVSELLTRNIRESCRSRFTTCLLKLEKWAYFYPEYRGDFVNLWNQSAGTLKQERVDASHFEKPGIKEKYPPPARSQPDPLIRTPPRASVSAPLPLPRAPSEVQVAVGNLVQQVKTAGSTAGAALGTFSLVLGILSVCLFCGVGAPIGVIAVVLGWVARQRVKAGLMPEPALRNARIGQITGTVGIVLSVAFWIWWDPPQWLSRSAARIGPSTQPQSSPAKVASVRQEKEPAEVARPDSRPARPAESPRLPRNQPAALTVGRVGLALSNTLEGLVINEVVKDGPAAKAGLEAGTVILGVREKDGSLTLLRNLKSQSERVDTVSGTASSKARLLVRRSGQTDSSEVEVNRDSRIGAYVSRPPWQVPSSLEIVGWGAGENNTVDTETGQNRQATVPDGISDVVAVACGDLFTIGLTRRGTAVAWGQTQVRWGEESFSIEPPESLRDCKAVAVGTVHVVALLGSGKIVCWGGGRRDSDKQSANKDDDKSYQFGQAAPPENLSSVTAIAAGGFFSLAVLQDGRVVGWGDNRFGQITPPEGLGTVRKVAAGRWHAMALTERGTVVCWGDNLHAQCTPPADLLDVVAVAAGRQFSLALKRDGTVVSWGDADEVPKGSADITAIAAGSFHALALRSNGTVSAWGAGSPEKRYDRVFWALGQASPPQGLDNVIAIFAGGNQSYALRDLQRAAKSRQMETGPKRTLPSP
jgi:serine/threonine protein kinase/alpha-tubulin suppressor-like RCC1 family protein